MTISKYQADVDALIQLLGPVGPGAEVVPSRRQADDSLGAHAQQGLERILSSSRDPSPDPRFRTPSARGRIVVGTVVAAAVAVAGIVAADVIDPHGVFGAGSSAAATPPPLVFVPVPGEASTVLEAVAESIQGLPDDAGVGPVAHSSSRVIPPPTGLLNASSPSPTSPASNLCTRRSARRCCATCWDA